MCVCVCTYVYIYMYIYIYIYIYIKRVFTLGSPPPPPNPCDMVLVRLGVAHVLRPIPTRYGTPQQRNHRGGVGCRGEGYHHRPHRTGGRIPLGGGAGGGGGGGGGGSPASYMPIICIILVCLFVRLILHRGSHALAFFPCIRCLFI